ncbi:MAG TPA: AMP-binding protein [Pilimelia sp.]|nr:AMP-binding protein [Pilimelia sp.]
MAEEPGPDLVAWPAEFADRYRRAGYWQGRTLGGLLREWSARHAARTALVAGDDRWTYAELDERVDRLAAGLHRIGLRPGDRVVVHLPNVPEFVVLCFALFRLGAAPVLALPAHRSSEISYLCTTSGAVAYVAPRTHAGFDYRALAAEVRRSVATLRHVLTVEELSELAPAESAALPEPEPGSVALFLLSGGTTGLPKLIPRTHDDYAYNVRASAEVCQLDTTTVYLAALPAAHNFALGCPGVLGTLGAGGTVVLAPSPSPPDAFPLIERERVTVTALVPPLAMLWIEAAGVARRDLSSLRMLQVGGAKLAPQVAAQVRPRLGCRLQQVYGMAEGLLCFTRPEDPDEIVLNTQGRPMSPADEVRIVDPDGADVPPGEVGELLTRGPYTLRGYYRAAAHNARAFTADGFYRTGDLVRATPSGHLVVTGRAKDVINRGGEKISAVEVEGHLLAHPDVLDAALVGMPDPMLGERGCAYVVPRTPGLTLAAVNDFLRTRGLADYKLPDRLEVIERLPGTGVGKVDKNALAADIAAKLTPRST